MSCCWLVEPVRGLSVVDACFEVIFHIIQGFSYSPKGSEGIELSGDVAKRVESEASEWCLTATFHKQENLWYHFYCLTSDFPLKCLKLTEGDAEQWKNVIEVSS